jgi:hypothetical protein
MKSAHFDTIVIIQSIPPGENRTGTKIHEDLDILNVAYDRNLNLKFFEVHTKIEFFELLTAIKNEAQTRGNKPVLHIETHGSSDKKGLVLSSNDYVSWVELKPFLIDINVATRNNLLVFMAACNGAHLTEIVDLTDRSPCWGLAGPTKSVLPNNLLRSFYEFYKELLSSGSGGKAVRALNSNSNNDEMEYSFTNSEMFFEKVYLNYIKKYCTKSSLETRAKSMYKKLKKDDMGTKQSVGQLKRMLKRTQEDYFNKYKNQFFMIDLYPENNQRFTVEYKRIINF